MDVLLNECEYITELNDTFPHDMVWPPEVQLELNCILPGSPVAVSLETPVLREEDVLTHL